MKTKLKDLECLLYISYPIINILLLFFNVSFSTRSLINRLIVLFFFVISNKYLLKNDIKKCILMDLFIFIYAIYLYIRVDSFLYLLNLDVVYFWFLIINLFAFSNKKIKNYVINYFYNNLTIVKVNTVITFVTCAFSLIFGNGFVSAQNTVVFKGFFDLEHTLAYHMVISYLYLLFYEKKHITKKHPLEKTFFVILIILSGVRSAFIVSLLFILVDFFMLSRSKRIIIILLLLCSFPLVISNNNFMYNIPMISKSIKADDAGDITNGRGELRRYALDYYFNKTSLEEKIIGISMKDLRNAYWDNLHAHNDFLNILLGYGLISLLLFIGLLLKNYNQSGCALSLLTIFILSFFNGLFMYFEIVFFIPIIDTALNTKKKGV